MPFVMRTQQAAASCFLLAMLSAALPGQQAARRTDAGNGLYGAPISNLRDVYPAARTGGNYMHNYYLPPVVEHALAAVLLARWRMDRLQHGGLDLEDSPRRGHRLRADRQPDL